MTSDRPYRRGMKPEVALARLCEHAGTQFDPAVVNAFVSIAARGDLDEPLSRVA